MKYQREIRVAVCAACAGIALSLTGCSISFCGMQIGGKDELVFSCGEDLPDEAGRITETASASSESRENAPVSDELDGQKETSVQSENTESDSREKASAQSEDLETGQETGESGEETARTDGRVNINSANTEELMTLNGIGETRAKAIVEYRAQNGVFTKVEDIMQVPGIKEGIFSKIQNQIAVD